MNLLKNALGTFRTIAEALRPIFTWKPFVIVMLAISILGLIQGIAKGATMGHNLWSIALVAYWAFDLYFIDKREKSAEEK